jgi:hypothetical protein
VVALLLATGTATVAAAQAEPPLVGLSGAVDRYVDRVEAPDGEVITIHACVFGGADREAVDQPLTVVRWVVFQACCGASLELVDVAFNPEFQHTGNPLAGVVSTLDGCRTGEALWLATLKVRLRAPRPGEYLWAAGSFGPAEDCEGLEIRLRDMPLQMSVPGDASWSALHAEFYDGPRRY